jgi:hypothetical protein
MNKSVVRALVESLVFLELSEDDNVNQDAAVRIMGSIGFHLQKLNRDERSAFADIVIEIAEEEPATEAGRERREYITRIPEYFGLDS